MYTEVHRESTVKNRAMKITDDSSNEMATKTGSQAELPDNKESAVTADSGPEVENEDDSSEAGQKLC